MDDHRNLNTRQTVTCDRCTLLAAPAVVPAHFSGDGVTRAAGFTRSFMAPVAFKAPACARALTTPDRTIPPRRSLARVFKAILQPRASRQWQCCAPPPPLPPPQTAAPLLDATAGTSFRQGNHLGPSCSPSIAHIPFCGSTVSFFMAIDAICACGTASEAWPCCTTRPATA